VPIPTAFPDARTPDPTSAPPLRWAVLAPGGIAHRFAKAVATMPAQSLVAVGSRSGERAEKFAAEYGIDRSYGSYAELVADPDVQAVYIASPHSEHRDHALLALGAGKHVLVEKAFTRNAAEARAVADAARSAGLVAVEAMWTRFLPHIDVVRQLLADGALGPVQTVMADHGQRFEPDPQHRMFAPELAGGALLDLGVYPISFASFVLGHPDRITAAGTLTDTGVDAQVSTVFSHGEAQAVVNTTLTGRTPITASITGTQGRLELDGSFYGPTVMRLIVNDGTVLTRERDDIDSPAGFTFQIGHVATLAAEGATESPLMPLDESIDILSSIDAIRAQLGVRYPGE